MLKPQCHRAPFLALCLSLFIFNLFVSSHGYTELSGISPLRQINPLKLWKASTSEHSLLPQIQFKLRRFSQHECNKSQQQQCDRSEHDSRQPRGHMSSSPLFWSALSLLTFFFFLLACHVRFDHIKSPAPSSCRSDLEELGKTYKLLNGRGPSYLSELLKPISSSCSSHRFVARVKKSGVYQEPPPPPPMCLISRLYPDFNVCLHSDQSFQLTSHPLLIFAVQNKPTIKKRKPRRRLDKEPKKSRR